jgi:hypothetical protein
MLEFLTPASAQALGTSKQPKSRWHSAPIVNQQFAAKA